MSDSPTWPEDGPVGVFGVLTVWDGGAAEIVTALVDDQPLVTKVS